MHKTKFDHKRFDFYPRNLITRVLTICHVNLTQSIALEQKPEKRLDFDDRFRRHKNRYYLVVTSLFKS